MPCLRDEMAPDRVPFTVCSFTHSEVKRDAAVRKKFEDALPSERSRSLKPSLGCFGLHGVSQWGNLGRRAVRAGDRATPR